MITFIFINHPIFGSPLLIFPLCREIWFSEAACSFHLPGRPGLDGDGYDNDFDDAGDDGDDVYKVMMICDVSPIWTLRFE